MNSDYHGKFPSTAGLRIEQRERGGAFSPPLATLEIIWKYSLDATGHSWTRLNGALRQHVKTMIEGGMPFDLGDFAWVREHYNSGYWSDFESWYSAAVEVRNLSACKSIEAAIERNPFILNGQRLAVGTEVCGICDCGNPTAAWKPLEWAYLPQVKVTSFSPGQAVINLTISEWRKHGPAKVKRRFPLTHEDLAAANALIRTAEKAKKKAAAAEAEKAEAS